MLKQTLERISKLGYEVSWHYEPSTNSIIIRANNNTYTLNQKVDLDIGLYVGGDAGFEFYMNLYLIEMLQKLEQYEKGESSNA